MNFSTITANNCDTGCREAWIYTDDRDHSICSLFEVFQFIFCNFGFVGFGIFLDQ